MQVDSDKHIHLDMDTIISFDIQSGQVSEGRSDLSVVSEGRSDLSVVSEGRSDLSVVSEGLSDLSVPSC